MNHWKTATIALVVTIAILAVVLVSTATLSVPWLAREGVRSATTELQSTMQLTRMEAVKRNTDCRVVVDTGALTLQVFDTNATSSKSDDPLLHTVRLPASVSFARPDSGSAVTFDDLGSNSYEVVFASDGSVSSGQGEAVLFGGGTYQRLTLYVAGGIRVARWNGSGWES